jgi:hypothetical protein
MEPVHVPVTFRGMGLEEPGDVGDDGLPLSQADATSARTSTHFPDFTTAALFERRTSRVHSTTTFARPAFGRGFTAARSSVGCYLFRDIERRVGATRVGWG